MKIPKIIFFSIACLLISHDNVYGGSNNSGQSASVNDLISPNPNSGNLSNAPTAKAKKHHHKKSVNQMNSQIDADVMANAEIGSTPSSGSGKVKKNAQGGSNVGASSGSHSGKSGKMKTLEQEVAKLQSDVKSLKQAVAALQNPAS